MTEDGNFEVGDEVQCIDYPLFYMVGKIGVVTEPAYGGFIKVLFDEQPLDGTSGPWYMLRSEVRKYG